ncbi:MAG: glycosyltransferase [Candidatus Saccharimonadaceae bacterium]|nr:glycosyltransferase [Candidatus Saccharimonadaceae bacterium]
MRIVIATAVYYPMINGVAVFSHNLARGLVRRGHEVMVICPSQTGRNYTRTVDGVKTVYLKSVDAKVYPDQIHAVPEKKKFLGVKIPHVVYKHGLRVSVFPQIEVKRALDRFRPDVVHVQVSDPIGLSVVWYARRHDIPVVTTEHNQPDVFTDPLKVPGLVKKPVNYLLSSYFRNRQSKSDFVTMPTEKAIKELIWSRKTEFPVPVAAVSNGVDLTNFRSGKPAFETYRKYNIPKDRPIVLYVGRVDPEKKLGLVIDAFNEARKKIPTAYMVVVGDGVDRMRMESKAKKMELWQDIRFLGKVLPPDLYELYKIGDVFATASEIETQGIVLIEAAACGLPLIAVDKGAVSEVCISGKNGFLCEPGNVKEISDAMVKILSDAKLGKEFAEKSTKIASEHDFEKTLDKFINIYKSVVEKKFSDNSA